jgi:hypothetical protein
MRMTYSFLIGLLAVAITFAQGPRAGMGQGQARGAGYGYGAGTGQPSLDINNQVVVEGLVTAVNISFGVRYPSIEVDGVQIKIAPLWFLLENDFELEEGDSLYIIAAASTATGDGYLHAILIRNTGTDEEITLRDELGIPLWIRGRGFSQDREPRGSGARNDCVDPASIQVISGTVEQVNAGAGIRQPTLTIRTEGQLVSVKIAPARILLANDFELNVGQPITAKVATATCTGELVALELTDKNGKTLTLRNDDGSPAW